MLWKWRGKVDFTTKENTEVEYFMLEYETIEFIYLMYIIEISSYLCLSN